MDYLQTFRSKIMTPEEAVSFVQSGDRVCLGSGCGCPETLVGALIGSASDFQEVEIVHLLTVGSAEYTKPEYEKSFRHNAFFVGGNVREAVNEGRADFIPIFLSEIPALFKDGTLPVDVTFIQVSPPDIHGFCSFGVSVDIVKPAAESSKVVIAEINHNMPRTLGDSFIHISRLDGIIEVDYPVQTLPKHEFSDVHKKIGRNVADLIEDGCTMQMGIGAIPDAVLFYLKEKRHLGIHTEMFSDGVMELVQSGVITNEQKTLHPWKIISSFLMGSKDLYDFVDNNPLIEFHPSNYTNDPFIISQNKNMVAINSALQVDLTGQVCADSIGIRQYSGIGGQVDFIRGAARSEGGKPIIALPSTAKGGTISRIVPTLDIGSGVVTSRGDIHWVVTEYGAVDLHARNFRQRARELIRIAHPNFREQLEKAARERKVL